MIDNDRVSSLWKTIAVALIGIVATGASAWMVFDQNVVSREEVSRMIAIESDWRTEREVVLQVLGESKIMLKQVAEDVTKVKVEQARLTERVELLMKQEMVARQQGGKYSR